MSKLVITGTGRSGTGWCAAILNSAGIFTGHERVFGPKQVRPYSFIDWAEYHADASWLAVPRLPLMNVRAALVVRNPLEVVASMAHLRFGMEPHINPFTQVASDAGMTPDPDGYLRFWLNWNQRAFPNVEAVFTFDQLLANPMTLTRWAGAKYEPHSMGVVNARDEWKHDERPVIDWDTFTDDGTADDARKLWEGLNP
jgi:hypothetical protein